HDKDGMSVRELMAATERTDRNAVDQLLYRMVRDGEIRRLRRGVYALPHDAGKIDKKERNGPQASDWQGEASNLTDLTDLTGSPDPAGEIRVAPNGKSPPVARWQGFSGGCDGEGYTAGSAAASEPPNDALEIPAFLDRRSEPPCAHCGQPGG